MADVRLPMTLTPLFAGLPRHVEIDAATVAGAIEQLEQRWPGLRDRLCEPGPGELRPHIPSTSTGNAPRSTPRSTEAPTSMSSPRSAAARC